MGKRGTNDIKKGARKRRVNEINHENNGRYTEKRKMKGRYVKEAERKGVTGKPIGKGREDVEMVRKIEKRKEKGISNTERE